jgi:hypothetical protein
MTIWTSSKGIIKRKALIEPCLKQKLSSLSLGFEASANDIVVGWGLKAVSNESLSGFSK